MLVCAATRQGFGVLSGNSFFIRCSSELGWRVEFAPDGEGGISPDLYIADSHEEYLVEATVLMEPESDARSELRRGPLMEGLSQVHTRDFWLGVADRFGG